MKECVRYSFTSKLGEPRKFGDHRKGVGSRQSGVENGR